MNHLNLEDGSDVMLFSKNQNFWTAIPSFNLMASGVHSDNTRNSEDVVTYHCRTDTFKHSFFPWTILKLDLTLRKSSYKISRNLLLKMIRPSSNLLYDIHNPLGLHLLTRLRLELSHLNEHKFNTILKTVLTHFVLPA